jgi:hypothetical protein
MVLNCEFFLGFVNCLEIDALDGALGVLIYRGQYNYRGTIAIDTYVGITDNDSNTNMSWSPRQPIQHV